MNKPLEKITILNVPIAKLSLKESAVLLLHVVQQNRKKLFHIVTANPEIVMKYQQDEELRQIVNSADLVTPDGIGIVMAAKWNGTPIRERVTGYDLLLALLEQGNETGLSLYFLGSDEETNKTAVERIALNYPNLRIAGRHHGFFGEQEERGILQEIERTRPDMLIVALGAPKAEKWINRNKEALGAKAAIGVGGSLDVIAGKVKATPELWKRVNLEWLHRLLTQPSRWRRQLILPVFACKAFLASKKS